LDRGVDEYVDWRWINSTGSEELYNNTNWTKLGFNDTQWKDGSTPFGDDDLGGIDYRTFWDGNNYGYFRHIVNIPDMGLYEGGLMTINVATNNAGDHYINGIYIFGDIDEDSHGAEYWNEEYQVYINYLNQGPNVIASIVSNPTNTQWFDQEIIMTFPQSNLWNYNDRTYQIPIVLDTKAPLTKVKENGFYKNSTIITLTWESISDENDLEGFYLYSQLKNGSSIGDWQLIDYFDSTFSTNFTGENKMIYRFKTIGVDSFGNKENKGTYDTEVKIDMDRPRSEVWLSEGDVGFTNLNGVTLNWKNNETFDIQAYIIEYKKENDSEWKNFGLFTGIGEYWFQPDSDGKYLIRSRSIDFSGNKELKDIPDIIITFDRLKPEVKLNELDILKNADDFNLKIKTKSENLSTINIEYARLLEGTEDILEWKAFDEDWNGNEFNIRNLVDGYTYYFRINPTDFAGNDNNREEFEYFIYCENSNDTKEITLPVIPLKPVMTGKIKNIEIRVDEDLNGMYEKILQEYNGKDLAGMKANQYWVDYSNGKIIFGDGDEGYLPPSNSSISIIYSGFDVFTTIDNKPPMHISEVEYSIEDNKNITIKWSEPEDASTYIIESRDNFSTPWKTLESINYTQNKMTYKVQNLSGGFYYYRIVSVDRMGYQNSNMEGEILEIFIETEEVNNAGKTNSGNDSLNTYILITGMLALVAISSAMYLIKNKNETIALNEKSASVLIPVNLVDDGIMDSEGEEIPAFTILQGSQFSRSMVFVCNGGCQHEFELDEGEDDDEIMCPHCGLMGDLPV